MLYLFIELSDTLVERIAMTDYRFSEMSREELEAYAKELLDEARSSAKVISKLDGKIQQEKKKTSLLTNMLKLRHGKVG